MRIAVLSDVHANLEALEAVLEDVRKCQVDCIYCLGDVVGYGADPEACLEFIQDSCQILLRGNHEEALSKNEFDVDMNPHAYKALQWTRRKLGDDLCQKLSAWPLVKVGAEARLVHGSPFEPQRFLYILSRWDCENAFRVFPEQICFCGHSHIPMVAEEISPGIIKRLAPTEVSLDPQCRYLINVGSVGQPRDGNPAARWVLVHSQPPSVQFREVQYNILQAQNKIIHAGLPEILAKRLALGQ